jgi:SAM-dependent methyltransferase
VGKQWLFDRKWTRDFTKVRQEFMGEFLGAVRREMSLASALDVGCGVGDFSKFLSDLEFRVKGVDGRQENAAEAQRRYPDIPFDTLNAEDVPVSSLGTFDLVLCFGLLYHLENPFRAIRHLHALADKLLLVEGMCIPDDQPAMELLDEGVAEDQGLSYVAFYPSESCLIKMLYRAGFPFVYRFRSLPDDELFKASPWRKKQRTFLAASKVSLSVPNLLLVRESSRWTPNDLDPWGTSLSRLRRRLLQIRLFGSRVLAPLRKVVSAKSR